MLPVEPLAVTKLVVVELLVEAFEVKKLDCVPHRVAMVASVEVKVLM